MNTAGRYMIAPVKDAESRGPKAALGYSDSLSDACADAHNFGCSSSPVGVYDTEKIGERVDFRYDIRSTEVHRTHR